MSRLLTTGGTVFASREAPFETLRAHAHDRLPRVFVRVAVEGVQTSAVVDTGGVYLIVNPEVGKQLNVSDPRATREKLVIRGLTCAGSLHRLPVTLLATNGESLTFEATAFVPELADGEAWPLPSYLGWQGLPGPHPFRGGPGGRGGVLRRGGRLRMRNRALAGWRKRGRCVERR